MKTTQARLAPFIFLLLLLCPGPAPAQPKPRAERSTYALGEKWIRSDGLYELIRVQKDRYVKDGIITAQGFTSTSSSRCPRSHARWAATSTRS